MATLVDQVNKKVMGLRKVRSKRHRLVKLKCLRAGKERQLIC